MIPIFIGASGVGKSTLMKELGKRFHHWTLITSTTTRPLRDSDLNINGNYEYERVARPVFDTLAKDDAFLKPYGPFGENDDYYGTKRWRFEQALRDETRVYMAAVMMPAPKDWIDAAADYGYTNDIFPILLTLDEAERHRRLKARRETNEARFAESTEKIRDNMCSVLEEWYELSADQTPGLLADQVVEYLKSKSPDSFK